MRNWAGGGYGAAEEMGRTAQAPPSIMQDEEFLLEIMEVRDSVEQLTEKLGLLDMKQDEASRDKLACILEELEQVVRHLDGRIEKVAEQVSNALDIKNNEPVDLAAAYQLTNKWKYLINARMAAAESLEKYRK